MLNKNRPEMNSFQTVENTLQRIRFYNVILERRSRVNTSLKSIFSQFFFTFYTSINLLTFFVIFHRKNLISIYYGTSLFHGIHQLFHLFMYEKPL